MSELTDLFNTFTTTLTQTSNKFETKLTNNSNRIESLVSESSSISNDIANLFTNNATFDENITVLKNIKVLGNINSISLSELSNLSRTERNIQDQLDEKQLILTDQINGGNNVTIDNDGKINVSFTTLEEKDTLLSTRVNKIDSQVDSLDAFSKSISSIIQSELTNPSVVQEEIVEVFDPVIWYKFQQNPISENILFDDNISKDIKYDMKIHDTVRNVNDHCSIFVDNIQKNLSSITENQYCFSFSETSVNNILNLTEDTLCDILLVGGGGSGGIKCGGGGAAGEYLFLENTMLTKGEYKIIIGSGGVGGLSVSGNGQNGSDTYITSNNDIDVYRVIGGGGGGGYGNVGLSGASSGGCGPGSIGNVSQNALVSTGNNGGSGSDSSKTSTGISTLSGGGGGGAGSVGGNATQTIPSVTGNGGDGICFDITGKNTLYAAGGGGGINHPELSYVLDNGGGLYVDNLYKKIGGNGSVGKADARNGVANTGSGGGGGGFNETESINGKNGSGGSGIVVIRFKFPGDLKQIDGLTTEYESSLKNCFSWTYPTNATYLSYDNVYGIQKLLNEMHMNKEFTIHLVCKIVEDMENSQILYIGNDSNDIIQIFTNKTNKTLHFTVGTTEKTVEIIENTYYALDLLFSRNDDDNSMYLDIYMNNSKISTTVVGVYDDVLKNVDTSELKYFIGRKGDSNAYPLCIQDFRIFTHLLNENQINQINNGNTSFKKNSEIITKTFEPEIWYKFEEDPYTETKICDSSDKDIKYDLTVKNINITSYLNHNLVAWYQFENNNSNMLHDSSGNSYDLTGISSPDVRKYITGTSSVYLSGTTDDYLEIHEKVNPYNISLTGIASKTDINDYTELVQNGITFTIWFNMSLDSSSNSRIFEFSDTGGSNHVRIMRNSSQKTLSFVINNISFTTAKEYVDNNWHHISWSISHEGKWNIYVDNILLTYSYTTITSIPDVEWTHRYIGKAATSDLYTTGNVDDFRIYNRVLTVTEISGVYYINKQIDTTSLWYKFNDNKMDMLQDKSGNDFILNNYGNASFDENHEHYVTGNGSVYFKGDNYLSISPMVFNPYQLANIQNGITISLWFKMSNNSPQNARIFDFGNGTNEYMYVSRNELENSLTFDISGTYFNTTDTYVDDNFHHLVWIITSSGEWMIYIDNIYINSDIKIKQIPNTTFNYMNLGRSSVIPISYTIQDDFVDVNHYMIGNLDDLRIYNRILTKSEIWSLYTVSGINNNLTINSSVIDITELWYKFNGDVTDSSSSKYHAKSFSKGVEVDLNYSDSIVKKGNYSLNLIGKNNEYVEINDSIDPYKISYINGISFSCWFKIPKTNEVSTRLFEFGNNTEGTDSTQNITVSTSDISGQEKIYFEILSDNKRTVFDLENGCIDNMWHHIVWSISSDGIWTIYFDNSYINHKLTENYPRQVPYANWQRKFIGKNTKAVSKYLTGNIYDFRIYNRILKSPEVASLYNVKQNDNMPVVWYKFNDLLSDDSDNKLNIDYNSGVLDTVNYRTGSKSIMFNTTLRQYATFNNDVNPYAIANVSGITFSCWFKIHQCTPSDSRIFEFGDNQEGEDSDNILSIQKNGTDNTLIFSIVASNDTLLNNIILSDTVNVANNSVAAGSTTFITSNSYIDDEWHHIVWSISTKGVWDIFVDNVLVSKHAGTFSGDQRPVPDAAWTKKYIGRSTSSTDIFTNGNIDDLRIYNNILNISKIETIFEDTQNNMVVDYKFDDNILDNSGNRLNGVNVNESTYSEANVNWGKNINLNGVNQYVEINENINPYDVMNVNGITFSLNFKVPSICEPGARLLEISDTEVSNWVNISKYNDNIQTNDLIVWHRFNNNKNDSSGNDYHLTTNSIFDYDTQINKMGIYSLKTNGTSEFAEFHPSVDPYSIQNMNDGITFSTWFKMPTSSSPNSRIFDFGNNSTDTRNMNTVKIEKNNAIDINEPTLWYRFENNATDSSPSVPNNDGTLIDNVAFDNTIYKVDSYSLQPAMGKYVNMPSSFNPSTNGSSFSGWFKLYHSSMSLYSGVFEFMDATKDNWITLYSYNQNAFDVTHSRALTDDESGNLLAHYKFEDAHIGNTNTILTDSSKYGNDITENGYAYPTNTIQCKVTLIQIVI